MNLRNHQNQQEGSQIGERSFIRSPILARILLWNGNTSGQRVSGSPAAGPGHGQRVTLSPSPCSCSVASSPLTAGGLEGSVPSAAAPEAALRLRPSPLQPRTPRGAANAAPGSSLHVCPALSKLRETTEGEKQSSTDSWARHELHYQPCSPRTDGSTGS